MTTQNAIHLSSPHKYPLLIKWAIRCLLGIGLGALMMITMLAGSPPLRDALAQGLLRWSETTQQAATTLKPQPLAMAPFMLDPNKPDGTDEFTFDNTSKFSVKTTSAYLPILDLENLSGRQVKLANWIAKRYHVAPQMVALLIRECWSIGERTNIDPTLLLAIIAIESRFNPYAQSSVGAAGLMQVMTNVHSEKFDRVAGGDVLTAYDPIVNLRVGVLVLQEHIKRAGSLEGGLKQYVGAVGSDDFGYASKVLAERDRITKVLIGNGKPTLQTILMASQNPQRDTIARDNSPQTIAQTTHMDPTPLAIQ